MKTTGALGACFSRSGSSSVCRCVYRFGFENLRKLVATAAKLVGDATAAIAYRDVARREETDFHGRIMSNLDEMTKKVRKLQLRATIAKTNLRDLAEDLPVQWIEIEDVAEKKHAVYAELDGARRELAKMKTLREEHIHQPRRLLLGAAIPDSYRWQDLYWLRPLFQGLLARGHASLRRR
ncbi:CCE_0567 family metalloprotein [Mesorhizobium loti]|uniref:CCE_0567 family metalloprotein n=1 Tax=Rhizobium loti TaxID=381 RepID=UPI003D7C21DA